MTTDIVKGMARAYHEASDTPQCSEKMMEAALLLLGDNVKENTDKMRRALIWLADNISDEMLHAAKAEADIQDAKGANEVDGARAIFAAAIRAAAGGRNEGA
jgi:hypothetical protein